MRKFMAGKKQLILFNKTIHSIVQLFNVARNINIQWKAGPACCVTNINHALL